MDKKILIFSGMPASGKDTVTDKLCEMDSHYTAFMKYKAVGPNDEIKNTYYNISREEFEIKIKNGNFLQYHGRYGRYYGIAEDTLAGLLEKNLIPIIHIGRIENYYMLLKNMPEFERKYGCSIKIVHVQLWETKEQLKLRISKRDKIDTEIKKREAAMEQEFEDAVSMMKRQEKPFSLVVKNTNIDQTCQSIIRYINDSCTEMLGYKEFWDYLKNL